MHLRHLKTLKAAADVSASDTRFPRVQCIACSSNNLKVAIATPDRFITLFDDEGIQRDRFPTKSSIAGSKAYSIAGLAFSPDCVRLAVAQSDNIVFVYKIGRTWADKKTICNKYPSPSTVTCLCWPAARQNELVFGAADGKVRLGNTANKCMTLYASESPVVSLCAGFDGQSFVSGHVDGSMIKYSFPRDPATSSSASAAAAASSAKGAHSLLTRLPFVPQAIAMNNDVILVGGNGNAILIFDHTGQQLQKFDYARDDSLREFTSAVIHPSGQTAVFANFHKCLILALNTSTRRWEESPSPILVPNLYSVTALAWRHDGTRLMTGSLFGALDSFDACLRRYIYKHDFEITYTSLSSLIVRHLSTGQRCALASRFSLAIDSLAVYRQQFVAARTKDSLIVADLNTGLQSEVSWNSPSSVSSSSSSSSQIAPRAREKFFWDADNCCLVYFAGELHVLEYGVNEIVASARTEFALPHLISLRITPARNANEGDARKLAYLLDRQTIRIIALASRVKPTAAAAPSASAHRAQPPAQFYVPDCTITHEHRIDWLELNSRGTKLLFRDKQGSIHLYDLITQSKHVLLHSASYVQWVPSSDVVVAQSRRQLYIWYSVDSPQSLSEVTLLPISGEVESIQRVSGKTEVIVDEGVRKSNLYLDEPLIAFGSAIDAHDFDNAVKILESFDASSQEHRPNSGPTPSPTHSSSSSGPSPPESNLGAMWQQLSKLAMAERNFPIAERCFAALGDMANTAFLHEINATIASNGGDSSHWLVQALICLTCKQWKRAESLYLTHAAIEPLLAMYRSMHKFQDALRVAETQQHPSLSAIRADYLAFLIATRQESLAGSLKEKEGDFEAALALYLKAGLAAKAADLIVRRGLHSNTSLCERVSTSLIAQRQFEAAGDFLLALSHSKRALDCFVKGACFHRAIELARREFPAQVVALEEQWGDSLFAQQQWDGACSHYIQCGKAMKALECAVEAKQWDRAMHMMAAGSSLSLASSSSTPAAQQAELKSYARRIATHLASVGQHSEAERLYVQADCAAEAVAMYSAAGLWEKAHAIAMTYMSESEARALYVSQALKLESQGAFKEAERLYGTVHEHALSIAMYRKHRLFDDMLRVMALHKKDAVSETHLQLGHQFETEGNFKQAEHHYVQAKEWKACYQMFKEQNQWEDALRVAKAHGGVDAYKQAAYEFAMSVGGEAGIKMLVKRGLAELAVDVAIERNEFEQAHAIADKACKNKVGDIHLAQAMALEDEGKFDAAEREFISAKKAKEAIDMWLHQQEWDRALRVAHDFEPSALGEIVDAQAKSLRESKDYQGAEALYVLHKKGAEAVKMYSEASLWDDAVRVAKQQAPRLLAQVQQQRDAHVASTSTLDTLEYSLSQASLAQSKRQYSQAIDHLLSISLERCKGDINVLEAHWESALELAHQHLPARAPEVLKTLVSRLLAMKRFESASQFLVDAKQYPEAIDALKEAQDWDGAKAIAQAHAPHLLASVTAAQSTVLLSRNNLTTLADVSPTLAIDAYVQNGEWDRVYPLAEKQGQAMVDKYVSLHAAALLKQNKARSAVRVFLTRGCPVLPANFPLYKRLCHEVLLVAGHVENPASTKNGGHTAADSFSAHALSVLHELRTMMWALMKDLRAIDPTGTPLTQELERLLLITHYTHLRSLPTTQDCPIVLKRLSTALLRYTKILPVDKAFYDAGYACRQSSDTSQAFVFFNRFVDVTDLMADPDSGDIDNSDFLETDIPSPFDTPLPSVQFYADDVREEAREWVLEKAMSHDLAQSLETRACDKCGSPTYEASLSCHRCHFVYEPCIVSAYPVVKAQRIQCQRCLKPANRDAWNKLVAKTKCCPWCAATANPFY